jgi:serine/threonine protein kinase
MFTSYFTFLRTLGYSKVNVLECINFPILTVCDDSGMHKIVKVLDGNVASEEHQNTILNEVKINLHIKKCGLSECIVPTIVQFDATTNVFYLIMHKMQGTLSDLSPSILSTNACDFIKQINKCIKSIHNMNIIHADICTQNIFFSVINGKYHLKLADFGLSNFSDTSSVTCGNIIHPKLLNGSLVDLFKIDRFQAEILFYNFKKVYSDNRVTRSGKVFSIL